MHAEMKNQNASDKALRLMKERTGLMRTADVLAMGIHPRTLYKLRDSGTLEQLSRGVYRVAGQAPISNPDLATVAVRCPRAVICLISALAFHEITTQVPHSVFVALPKGSESPRIDYPPVSVHRFSEQSFAAGIEEHELDGVPIRVYSPEKTLADCFKFRNLVGMDAVLESLKLYRQRKGFDVAALLKYARVCRVEAIMRPYLEALI